MATFLYRALLTAALAQGTSAVPPRDSVAAPPATAAPDSTDGRGWAARGRVYLAQLIADRNEQPRRDTVWTRAVLECIAERPATRAPDLAESFGRETQPFKLDVRKLKNLGLTISLTTGYRLSPRGEAYLATDRARASRRTPSDS